MNPSQKCVDLIKQFEGCNLTPYKDSAGIWTVGYGTTQGVIVNQSITQEQAEDYLQKDIARVALNVTQAVRVPLTQNQFDALVCFTYNVGITAFLNSTLLKLLNSGDYKNAQAQFQRWVYSTDPKTHKKVVLAGLQTRRAAEASLFGLDDNTTESSHTPVQPPAVSQYTTTGKMSIGVIGTSVAAAVIQGVQTVQPVIQAAQTANSNVSGLPSILKFAAIILTISAIGFGIITFYHKQKTLKGL